MYDNEACIVGIGTSAFGFDLGKSPLRLETEALVAALGDAGIDKAAIDGFATAHGTPNGVDYDEFVAACGLDIRWVTQLWSHGRWTSHLVTEAALAVSAGLADYVAIANTSTTGRAYGGHLRGQGGGTREAFREFGGSDGEWGIHGIDSPGAATSLVAQRYMDKYGATPDDLAEIPLAFRAAANKNPQAIMRDKVMTRESYFAEPVIAGPFRRPDFCLANEGATCLIVTTTERARDLDVASIVISGFQGMHASRDDSVLFARQGLGVGIGEEFALSTRREAVYAMAGATPNEIDALYLYDSFSSNAWMVLERFGFCGEGEAPAFVRERGIGLGSAMPINTNGGLLSESHVMGMGHLIEMVRQLRGGAEERQVPAAELVQWATPNGDSLILRRGQ